MKNWTIKKRIIAGFAVIVTLSAIMGILAWNSLRTIGEHADSLANNGLPGLSLEANLKQNLEDANLALIRHVLTANVDEKLGYQNKIQEIAAENSKLVGDLEKVCDSPEEKALFEKMSQARQDYIDARTPILQLSNAGTSTNNEAMTLLLSSGRTTFDAYEKLSTDFNALETRLASGSADAIQHSANASKIVLATVVLGELVVSVILGFLVVTGLNRVLQRVSSALGEGAEQVTSAATQVSSSSQTLAEGSSEQAASLEETSASLEEMASMTRRNAENAQKANDLAKQARTAADKGTVDMQTMNAAMDAIKVSSDDIAKIIKTIDEIAFQTNILALNAAVEAARAGEAGMGFAVVADEVRNLAQRSAQAAKETAGKIEGAIVKTTQGVEISKQVAETLNEIATKARQVDELVAEVAGASREQTQGITQVNTAVGQMDKVTQSNAASAEESAAAAQELNAQAVAMKESVAELLHLVGGNRQSPPTQAATAPAHFKRVRSATPQAKRSAPASTRGNGNGHNHAALVTAGNRPSEIPLEGDFKDF